VSPFEVADGEEAETHVGTDGLLQLADGEEGFVPAPETARRPTGDDAVDQVLGQFDAVTDGPLDTQIDVGEQVLRVLQGRLADLGKE
jgi:hypothetical protein